MATGWMMTGDKEQGPVRDDQVSRARTGRDHQPVDKCVDGKAGIGEFL